MEFFVFYCCILNKFGNVRFVVAGAIAGTAEHCGMFPLDTIKVISLYFQYYLIV